MSIICLCSVSIELHSNLYTHSNSETFVNGELQIQCCNHETNDHTQNKHQAIDCEPFDMEMLGSLLKMDFPLLLQNTRIDNQMKIKSDKRTKDQFAIGSQICHLVSYVCCTQN